MGHGMARGQRSDAQSEKKKLSDAHLAILKIFDRDMKIFYFTSYLLKSHKFLSYFSFKINLSIKKQKLSLSKNGIPIFLFEVICI